jgi:hypothetical protein
VNTRTAEANKQENPGGWRSAEVGGMVVKGTRNTYPREQLCKIDRYISETKKANQSPTANVEEQTQSLTADTSENRN